MKKFKSVHAFIIMWGAFTQFLNVSFASTGYVCKGTDNRLSEITYYVTVLPDFKNIVFQREQESLVRDQVTIMSCQPNQEVPAKLLCKNSTIEGNYVVELEREFSRVRAIVSIIGFSGLLWTRALLSCNAQDVGD